MRSGWVLRAGAFAALLATLGVFEATGLTRLRGWSDIGPEEVPYTSLLAAYFGTWLAVRSAPGATRRASLLGGSLACAYLFDPWFAVGSVAWLAVFHQVLFAGGRAHPGLGLAYVLATFVGLGIACSRDLWPEFLDSHPMLSRWGYLFGVAYTFRIAWLLHEVRLRRVAMPLVDMLLYFVFAPFFVIVPYMLAIPRCDRFRAGLDAHDAELERSGIRLVAWGLVLTLCAWLVREAYDPRTWFFASLRAHDLGAIALHSLPAYPVQGAIEVCAIVAILTGMVRALGIDLGPSFQRPLAAQTITEFWRRWNTHFRDLLVDLFYVPIAMRLRRTPVRGIVFGCVAVFVVGSTLFHFPKHYFRYGSIYPPNLHILVENILMCAVVAFALVRERRETQAGVEPILPSPLRAMLRAVRTWIVLLVIVVYAGYGAQHAVFGYRPPIAIEQRK